MEQLLHAPPLQSSTPDQLCSLHDTLPNSASSDHFSVDELLDFSNHDDFLQPSDEERDCVDVASVSLPAQQLNHYSIVPVLPSLPSSGFAVSREELANLEWLSHFVEDSFSGSSCSFPSAGISFRQDAAAVEKPENDGSVFLPKPCFMTPVPVKARTKRRRNGGRVWCLASPSLTESSSSSTTSSSSSSPVSPWFLLPDRFEPDILVTKKSKRKRPSEKVGTATATQAHRRCIHCGVQKTPQWRSGPLGAKTLCNACGVRYKSGRLVPEYRPACSPNFSSELHSNHHRTIIEMRWKSETTAPPKF